MAIKSGYETFKGPKGPIRIKNIVFRFARTIELEIRNIRFEISGGLPQARLSILDSEEPMGLTEPPRTVRGALSVINPIKIGY